jgi:deazaflavin-dependent oxidoreductase (nitroreductase family)
MADVPARELADDFVYVTTTGRVSGRPHEIEIWYARSGDTLYLLAGGGRGSDWVRNLAADPACGVRLKGTEHRGMARILDEPGALADPAEERRARDLVFAKYDPGYDGSLASWRDAALPVAIDLVGGAGAQA